MGALIGLLAGVGLLLLWHGLSAPGRPAARPTSVSTLRTHLDEAGLNTVRPAQFLLTQAFSGIVCLFLVYVTTGSVAVAGVFGGFGLYLPRVLLARLRHRRRAEFREVWPEVVDNLLSAVRAGMSLPEALSALGTRGPEVLREPFRQFGADYRTTGKFNTSLDRLKAALADPIGDRVTESLRVAREVGGTDLGRLLGTLSGFLRDDARTRSELLARQSWSLNAARMAVAAPWLVLLLLATQQETLAAYDTPTGTVILLAGAGVSVLAYRLMVRIGRLPADRRVLQ